MKADNYCVYIHRNIINNKAYVGITKNGDKPNDRWRNGKGYPSWSFLGKAIQKYGWDNFEHIVWSNELSEDEAQKLEVMLIALFHTTDPNYGYNISPGGEPLSITDIEMLKRTTIIQETKKQNRIQKSITMFKDRYDNGDENILQCQKCGAYFEKNKTSKKKDKRDAGKKQKGRIKRKYCDYCSTYHKRTKRIVVCVDCGKEFLVKSRDTKTCRCEECKQINIQQKQNQTEK